VSELDELERELLEAADTWFSQTLHLKLQRLIAAARDGERWKKTAMEFIARMPNPPKFTLPPDGPVDQPVAPKSSPGGGAAAFVDTPLDLTYRFHEDQL